MRFAITATDRYLGVFEALVGAGWHPLKLFTTPVDDRLFHNKATIDYARRLNIPIQLSPIGERDFEELARLGCEVLAVASYNHRIGDWSPYLGYAVNFHPSPLPLGRGPYPIVKAIRDRYSSWGVTCHKLSPEFDAGDILACERFALGDAECHDSLDLKIQMAAKKLASHVASRFVGLWSSAQPQRGGCYWKFWTDDEQTINPRDSVADILLQSRAFGGHETFLHLKGFKLRVRRLVGWTENHPHAPGTPVHNCNDTVVVAVRDGYIALTDWLAENAPEQASRLPAASPAPMAPGAEQPIAARGVIPNQASALAASC
jgi:methionyl-tRNA formyltransferase